MSCAIQLHQHSVAFARQSLTAVKEEEAQPWPDFRTVQKQYSDTPMLTRGRSLS